MKFIHHPGIKQQVVYLLVLLTFIFSFGCFHEFYKVQQSSLEDFKETVNTNQIKNSEYFVLHHQDAAMHLYDVHLQDGRLTGNLTELPTEREHDPKAYEKPVRYRPYEKYILQETHVFLDEEQPFGFEPGPIDIPISSITEIHQYDKATGKTIFSHAIGILGIATGVAIIAGTIIVVSYGGFGPMNVSRNPATGEITSCPFAYAYNGETFQLQGEIFAGAIFPNLERHDYLPLPDIQTVDDSYQIRISNEQKEFQHINLAELVVVEHTENSSAVLDQKGKAHTVTSLQEPQTATAPNGKDLLSTVRDKDQQAYFFDEGNELQNYVTLRFEKPSQANSAKLLLNARESYWSLLMVETYTSSLGTEYDNWASQMEELPVEAIYDLLDKQGLRLGVYLQVDGDWQLVERVNNVGPIAFRDVLIPIDLSDHQGDEVQIKLEAGHLFWEVNYAAMDFTNDQEVFYHQLKPGFAKASDGKTYTKALAKDDLKYLDLTYGGNQVTIWYPAIPERAGYGQSIFLHSKGHYEHMRDYDWPPEIIGLPQLDQPGSFIEFSNKHFEQFLEANNRSN